jgi:hypothetical protein
LLEARFVDPQIAPLAGATRQFSREAGSCCCARTQGPGGTLTAGALRARLGEPLNRANAPRSTDRNAPLLLAFANRRGGGARARVDS